MTPLCTIAVFGVEDYYAMQMTDPDGHVIAGATAPSIHQLADALTDALVDWTILPPEAARTGAPCPPGLSGEGR